MACGGQNHLGGAVTLTTPIEGLGEGGNDRLRITALV